MIGQQRQGLDRLRRGQQARRPRPMRRPASRLWPRPAAPTLRTERSGRSLSTAAKRCRRCATDATDQGIDQARRHPARAPRPERWRPGGRRAAPRSRRSASSARRRSRDRWSPAGRTAVGSAAWRRAPAWPYRRGSPRSGCRRGGTAGRGGGHPGPWRPASCTAPGRACRCSGRASRRHRSARRRRAGPAADRAASTGVIGSARRP